MNKLLKFSAVSLTREEMKSISGGISVNCDCTTGSGCNVGSWSGTYATREDTIAAIHNYCSCGGICTVHQQ